MHIEQYVVYPLALRTRLDELGVGVAVVDVVARARRLHSLVVTMA